MQSVLQFFHSCHQRIKIKRIRINEITVHIRIVRSPIIQNLLRRKKRDSSSRVLVIINVFQSVICAPMLDNGIIMLGPPMQPHYPYMYRIVVS